ncbi:hypothetical protein ACT453_36200, partial [Bacillus sp. D-CC]
IFNKTFIIIIEDEETDTGSSPTSSEIKGYNKIIYGAPGAGKSATVSKVVGKNYIRTVFHQESE